MIATVTELSKIFTPGGVNFFWQDSKFSTFFEFPSKVATSVFKLFPKKTKKKLFYHSGTGLGGRRNFFDKPEATVRIRAWQFRENALLHSGLWAPSVPAEAVESFCVIFASIFASFCVNFCFIFASIFASFFASIFASRWRHRKRRCWASEVTREKFFFLIVQANLKKAMFFAKVFFQNF